MIDKDGDKSAVRYLAFDCVAFNGHPLRTTVFDRRLKVLRYEIVGPRKDDKTYAYERETIHIRAKDFYPLRTVRSLLISMGPSLSHGFAGLVFVPLQGQYESGRSGKVLFWDLLCRFRVLVEEENSANVNDGNQKHNLFMLANDRSGLVKLQQNVQGIPPSIHSKCVECRWNAESQMWVFEHMFEFALATPSRQSTIQWMQGPDYLNLDQLLTVLQSLQTLPLYADEQRPAQPPQQPSQ